MTTSIGWNGVVVPGAAAATAVTGPADPVLVQRFNEAMVPQSVVSRSADAAPVDRTLATDRELARLPRSLLEQLQVRWAQDDTSLRQHAKVMLDLIEKPIERNIMKAIQKSFRRDDD